MSPFEYLNSFIPLLSDLSTPAERVQSHIYYFRSGKHATALNNLTIQIQCLFWNKASPRFSCTENYKAKSSAEKKLWALESVEKAIQGEFNKQDLYDFKKDTITYNNVETPVIQLMIEDYGFILYQSSHKNSYFLDVVFNHSAAYWNKIAQITDEVAFDFLKKPSYETAREIMNNAQ